MTITHAECERLCSILQRLAQRSAITSDERLALKTAAQALLFVTLKHQAEFGDFLKEIDAQLSDEQKAKIKDMGLTE